MFWVMGTDEIKKMRLLLWMLKVFVQWVCFPVHEKGEMEGNTEKKKNPGMKRALLWSGNLVPGRICWLFDTGGDEGWDKTLSGYR